MKKKHPLRRLISSHQYQLIQLCNQTSMYLEDSINPIFFNAYTDQLTLKITSGDFTDHVSNLLTAGVREGVRKTLDHLIKETGKNLDETELLFLEAKIENQLRRNFMGKTLRERLLSSERFTRNILLQTYRMKQAGLETSFHDSFTGLGQTIFMWSNRLVTTELLRTYHYTVMEFAKMTKATHITFVFDQDQLDRREEYQLLADGGPYKVDELPDYPRPYASYLLEIIY